MTATLSIHTTLQPNHSIQFKGHEIIFNEGRAQVPGELAIQLCGSRPGYRLDGALADFSSDTWTPDRKSLVWDGTFSAHTGYGYVAEMMVTALEELGVTVLPTGRTHQTKHLNEKALQVLARATRHDGWGLRHSQVDEYDQLATARRVRYTMWETTRLPPGMAARINERVELLVVPSTHQIEIFRENGVTVPIEVVTHGVDSAMYRFRPRAKESGEFVFGTAGYASKRKGTDVVLEAFRKAFPNERDVRLIVKTRPGTLDLRDADERIVVIDQSLSPEALADLLASFDVGVFASRGEGFGLYGLQQMSVGRTVICTNWLGMSDYMDPRYNFPLQYELTEAGGQFVDQWPRTFGLRYWGKWAEPSQDHLQELMRYCYHHRDEVLERGRACSDWVRREWTWQRAARQLISAIDGRTRATAPGQNP